MYQLLNIIAIGLRPGGIYSLVAFHGRIVQSGTARDLLGDRKVQETYNGPLTRGIAASTARAIEVWETG